MDARRQGRYFACVWKWLSEYWPVIPRWFTRKSDHRFLSAQRSNAIVKQHLAKYAPMKQESFVVLNTAFVSDGAFIYLPANIQIEKPVHVLYVNDSEFHPTVIYPRNLIVADKNASVKVAVSYHSIGSTNAGFTNAVTEVVAGQNAQVELIKIQNENESAFHISHTEAILSKDSVLILVRLHWEVKLFATTFTSYWVKRIVLHTFTDCILLTEINWLIIIHWLIIWVRIVKAMNCTKVYWAENLLAYLTERYLFVRMRRKRTLINPTKIFCWVTKQPWTLKPQLEIFADDVKCSHGATTGQMDAEALFYLRSRESENRKQSFLNIAFAADVIKTFPSRHCRDRLMPLIENKLKQNAYNHEVQSCIGISCTPYIWCSGVAQGFPWYCIRKPTENRLSILIMLPLPKSLLPWFMRFRNIIRQQTRIFTEVCTTWVKKPRKPLMMSGQRFNNSFMPDRRKNHFVHGTTEGINLVAATFGRMSVSAGDEILVSAMEHHSNIVPRQLLCEERKLCWR